MGGSQKEKYGEILRLFEKMIKKSGIDVTSRPSWKEYFMGMAEFVALRSTCHNRKVGVVVARDKRIVATGYNGAASDITSCFQMGYCLRKDLEKGERKDSEKYREDCRKLLEEKTAEKVIKDIDYAAKYRAQRYCRAQHAEENAITQASRLGIPLEGADVYVTLDPCERCTKLIISSKIKRVYMGRHYNDSDKHDDELSRMLDKDKLQSNTSFEYMDITDKIRLLIANEMFKGNMSRNRSDPK